MIGQFVAVALPASIASLVEFVEALTIVLAVGATRGWRSALADAPLQPLRIVLGALLVFFGLRWLRKASLRYAGAIPMGDETQRFAHTRAGLGRAGLSASVDGEGLLTAFNGVVIEGLEIVFIVVAVGASSHSLGLATLGAATAGLIVIVLAVMLRKPLTRVPANTLKFAVGLMLSALGTLWLGEGLNVAWPGDDFSALGIGAAYLAAAGIGIGLWRRRSRQAAEGQPA